MEKAYYWYNIYLRDEIYETDEDYWTLQPVEKASVLYSVITPLVCFMGMCGNIVCLIVLLRRELKASVFTYLSVMAATDLLKCAGLFFSGITTILWDTDAGGFALADALVAAPLGSMISSLSTIATVAVSLDRVIFLWDPTIGTKPKLCKKEIARKIMTVSTIFSIIFNLPYCFIFKMDENAKIVTTPFFHSEYYAFHNWLGFILFGVIPAVILTVVNTMLIVAIKKAWKMKTRCRQNMGKQKDIRAFWDQVYLTMTLVAVVFLFLIGEVPLQLLSRKSAITFVYSNQSECCDHPSNMLKTFREVCIILSAVHVSVNFILYCAFCPQFMRILKKLLGHGRRASSMKTTNNLPKLANIFMVKGHLTKKYTEEIFIKDRKNDLPALKNSDNSIESTTEDSSSTGTHHNNRY